MVYSEIQNLCTYILYDSLIAVTGLEIRILYSSLKIKLFNIYVKLSSISNSVLFSVSGK